MTLLILGCLAPFAQVPFWLIVERIEGREITRPVRRVGETEEPR